MKKGFTLIELLAVIVILAIIALIATPIILNIINDARTQSMINSAQLYVDGLVKQIASENLINEFNPSTCTVTNGSVSCDGRSLEYQINGKSPTSGTIMFDNGVVTSYFLSFDDLVVVKDQNGANIVDTSNINFNGIFVAAKSYEIHKGIVYMDPTDLTRVCNATIASTNLNSNSKGTGITSGCMKFYVYDDSGLTYKLILDHNTSGNLPYSQSEINERLASDTAGWVGNPRLITANELAHIAGADLNTTIKWDVSKTYAENPTNIDTEISWYALFGVKKTANTTYSSSDGWRRYILPNKFSWLYSNLYQSYATGEDNNAYPYPTPTSETTSAIYGYWTSDEVNGDSSKMWVITSSDYKVIAEDKSSTRYGIRPVIEIDKITFNKQLAYNITKIAAGQNDSHKGIMYLDPTDPRVTCTAQDAQDNHNSYYTGTSYIGVKTGCMKFYIYNDDGDDYKLILDHCVYKEIAYDNSYGPGDTIRNRLAFDTEGWYWSADLIGASDIAHIVGADREDTIKWDINKPLVENSLNPATVPNPDTEVSWFDFNGSGTTYSEWRVSASAENKSKHAWLYDNLGYCVSYGCNAEDPNGTSGYWTKDSVTGNSQFAWRVTNSGTLSAYYKNNSGVYSLRPTIIIPKSLVD